MFHRGANSKRNGGGIKPRKFKKRNPIPHPEWDNTTQDLTIHAASPEEIQRRRIVRKSKNADAARRELKAKKAGIPPSLMVSPAKLQLEMKKLALLRNVLYDQNDFTEVLRRADKTMTSVKGALHEKNYTNAYPHVTVAPGYKEQHPMKFAEQPSRLDALSESIMDGTALNEHVNEEESDDGDYEDCQFESKLNCDHFLSILKDAMNNRSLADSSKFKTPETNKHVSALNGTDQVKRVQSFVVRQPQQQQHAPTQRSKEIGNLIAAIAQDASKVKRKLDVSAIQLPHQPPSSSVQLSTTNGSMTSSLPSTIAPPPPRANISKCSMTYDDLQDAMKKVEKDMSVFDERRGMGNKSADDSMSFGGGLAGFTKTLLDAITRLIGYVNEGELKHQETCKNLDDVWKKLNHVTAISDALTVELKNEKVRGSVQQEEIGSLKQIIERDRSDHAKLIAQLREDVNSLKSSMNELKAKPNSSVKDAIVNDEELVTVELQGGGDASIDEPECSVAVIKPKEPMIDPLLKKDMLSLLSALKSQNYQGEANVEKETSSVSEKATYTITSVENQLSNLRRQHDEAEKRMKDLIKLADIPISNTSSTSSNNTTPLKDLPPQSPTQEIDFDVSALIGSESSPHQTSLLSTDSSSTMTPLSGGVYCDASPPVIPIVKVKRQTNLPSYFDPDTSGDTSLVNGKSGDKQASSGLSPLNAIRKDQLSLEDRIAQLTRQHSEAKTRLHHLRRHNVSKRADQNQQEKKVQVSIPNPQTLETPNQ